MDKTKIKLLAMDMDGTITQHKSRLEPFNRQVLEKLAGLYRLIIIGAGDCRRINGQLEYYPIDIIGNYGMQLAANTNGELFFLKKHTENINKEDITERVYLLRKRLNLNSYTGASVEFHDSGSITIPILGTGARLEEKLAFDPSREKRRKIYAEVAAVFSEFSVFIGGSSSFDITPAPFNKLYALNEYAQSNGYSHDEIVYIGDDYGPGGNDEQIYKSDISFICVDDYREFGEALKCLL